MAGAVGASALGNGTFVKHLTARKHRKARTRKVLLIALSLTSMVDMFSLLVIFLLQTFSTSPEMVVAARGVVLPSAATGQEIKDAPVLSLSDEGVFLDQKRIGALDVILGNPEPLMERLAELRKLWLKTHPGEAFKGEINLQGHRGIAGTTVSQFMAMLPSQHYGSIQLITLADGGGR
jgi:biopolymer transport protein ExbD